MERWSRLVVLLAVAAAAADPLINKLEPGTEWPSRHSVGQPGDPPAVPVPAQVEGVEEAPVEVNANAPVAEEDSDSDDEVLVLPKAVDLAKDNEKVDYSGTQVWKISTNNNTRVRAVIRRLRRRNLIKTWSGNQTYLDILVKPNAIQNVTRVLSRENITYAIVIDDLQKMIEAENPPIDENDLTDRGARAYNFWRYRASRRRVGLIGAYMGYNSLNMPMEYWPNANWGHRMTWKQYHRVNDIYEFLDYLSKTYPAIVTVQTIGKSHEGRDLKVLRISDGKPGNKAVFIDGGIHAREWISPATVTYFINQIAENFDAESDDFKNVDWFFLPVVNPDGYEYTHGYDRMWRKNRKPGGLSRVCVGTDLNRNFGYRWGGKGASTNPCSDIFRGARAFSEPESRALRDYIKNHNVKYSAYLTYHSYGQYILHPWGYDNVLTEDHQELDDVGNDVAKAIQQTGGSVYSVGSSSGLLYAAAGGSDDWAKSEGIKYSYTIELSDTGRYGFILPASYIEPVGRESLAGLRALIAQIHKE